MKLLFALNLILAVHIGWPVDVAGDLQESPYWYNWEEGVEKVKKEGKFALLLIAREDCTLTDHYLQSSFSTKGVREILHDRFVPIHINDIPKKRSSVQPILGFTQKSAQLPAGVQQLLSSENLHSPTLVVLDSQLKVLQSFSGYLQGKTLAEILVYYGEGHYKKTPWEKFHKAH